MKLERSKSRDPAKEREPSSLTPRPLTQSNLLPLSIFIGFGSVSSPSRATLKEKEQKEEQKENET